MVRPPTSQGPGIAWPPSPWHSPILAILGGAPAVLQRAPTSARTVPTFGTAHSVPSSLRSPPIFILLLQPLLPLLLFLLSLTSLSSPHDNPNPPVLLRQLQVTNVCLFLLSFVDPWIQVSRVSPSSFVLSFSSSPSRHWLLASGFSYPHLVYRPVRLYTF